MISIGIYSDVLTQFREPKVIKDKPVLVFAEDGTPSVAPKAEAKAEPKPQPAPTPVPPPEAPTPTTARPPTPETERTPEPKPAPPPPPEPARPGKTPAPTLEPLPPPDKRGSKQKPAWVETFPPWDLSDLPPVSLESSNAILAKINLRQVVGNLSARAAERKAGESSSLSKIKIIESLFLDIDGNKTPWAVLDVPVQEASLELPKLLARLAKTLKEEARSQGIKPETFRLVAVAQNAPGPVREALRTAGLNATHTEGLATSVIQSYRPTCRADDILNGKTNPVEYLQGKIIVALIPEAVIPDGSAAIYSNVGRLLIHYGSFLGALKPALVIGNNEVIVE